MLAIIDIELITITDIKYIAEMNKVYLLFAIKFILKLNKYITDSGH